MIPGLRDSSNGRSRLRQTPAPVTSLQGPRPSWAPFATRLLLVEFVALALAPQGSDIDGKGFGCILERWRLRQDARYLFTF